MPHDQSQEKFNQRADVVFAFFAGMIFTLVLSMVISGLAQ